MAAGVEGPAPSGAVGWVTGGALHHGSMNRTRTQARRLQFAKMALWSGAAWLAAGLGAYAFARIGLALWALHHQ